MPGVLFPPSYLPILLCSTPSHASLPHNPGGLSWPPPLPLLLTISVIGQRWTGSTFVKCSLKSLGLRIQLNHLGLKCANPEPCHSKFTVLHTNGIHEVAFDYCNCRPLSKFRQLLRRGLYPSSQENPRSCATFTLLEQLHMVNLTTKCSTYDFYRALEKLTNNRGIDIPKSKYRLLLRILLQWRHLKMLKRAGRGHDESGARGTQEGELALVCPSCPHPGINIPDDWANASPEKR